MKSSFWQSFGSVYDLDELFQVVQFSREDLRAIAVEHPAKDDTSHHAIAWVKYILSTDVHVPHSYTLTYQSDRTVVALEKGLIPFRAPLINRPDGVILCDYNDWKLPLFFIEVHSSPYKNTVSQTAVDVLDQLRLLRCFSPNIQECVGFAFPKYGTRSVVTKVKVSFENFRFVIRLLPLTSTTVKENIINALSSAVSITFDPEPQFCFMRLSRKDLGIASTALRSSVEQCATKHSLLLKSEEAFWKCVPRLTERENINLLNLTVSLGQHNLHHVTVYTTAGIIGSQTFFCYPAQLPPLRTDEVGLCLRDFMTRTAAALEELHGLGFAHLDVRVPNICFAHERKKNTYIVKLIDLDRCVRTQEGEDLSGFTGEMYRRPPLEKWKSTQFDWKQLGLLAAAIIFGLNHEDIVTNHKVREDQCLNQLIHKGKL